MANLLGHYLVERNRIAKSPARRVRRGGEKAIIGWVTSIHIGMRYSTEYGEIVSVLLEHIQVGRKLIPKSRFLREKLLGEQTQVVTDSQHATWRLLAC